MVDNTRNDLDEPSRAELITLREAAELSGLSPNHLRLLVGRRENSINLATDPDSIDHTGFFANDWGDSNIVFICNLGSSHLQSSVTAVQQIEPRIVVMSGRSGTWRPLEKAGGAAGRPPLPSITTPTRGKSRAAEVDGFSR